MHPRHSLSFCALVVALSLWLAVSGAAVAAGEVDPTFGTAGYTLTPVANGVTPHLAVDGSNRILVANYVGTNQYDFGLSRYTADGVLDTTFGTGGVAPAVDFFSGGNDTPCGVVVLTQGANAGKIVVAGTATNLNPASTYLALVRYNSNGALDATFGTNGKVTIMVGPLLSQWSAVTIDGSDNLYVAGEYSTVSNDHISTVVKLTAAGGVVQTYEANVATGSVNWQLFESPYAVAVQSDGKVVAGGYKNGGANGVNAMSLMRFTAAGPGLDTAGFNSPNGWLSLNFGASTPNDLVGGIAIQPSDGKIVAAGNGLTVNGGNAAFFAARFNTDGTLDTTGFGSGTGKVIVNVAGGAADLYNAFVQSDGKIVLFGIANSSTSAPWHVAVVRLNSDGSLDTTFGSGGKRLLDFGGQTQQGLPEARWQSTGKLVFAAQTTLGTGSALGLGRLVMTDQAMAYSSGVTTQNTADVQRGVGPTHVIGLRISVIGSQSPLALTSLTFNTTGTTNVADLSQAQAYYTGVSSAFNTSTPVGAPVANPNGTFTISLNQSLVSGENYLWLAYTIPSSATVNDVVDAECTSFTLGGVARTPTPTAPTGSRRIVAAFYPAITGDTQYADAITRFAFAGIDNSSGVSAGGYGDYSGSLPAATIVQGQTLTAAVTISGTFTGSDGADYWVKVWVDWNHNYDFSDAGEAYTIVSTARAVGPWTGPIAAPVSALPGATRLRVATQWRDVPSYSGYLSMGGEAEDYALNVTLPATPDVGVHKVRNGTGVVAGQPVSYTITVTNSGTAAATGWTVADTVPGALTGATWTCVSSGGAACGAGSGSGSINQTVNVPVGGVATYVLSATVSGGASGVLSNTASVVVPGGATDSDLSNNTATAQDTISRPADLSIAKTDGATAAIPGLPLVYTITVTNSGPMSVTGATVADALPAALTGATWTCAGAGGVGGAQCGATNGNGAINQAVNLPVGGSATYVLTASVGSAATGTLANTATVAAPAGVTDPNPADNTATDTDTLTPRADLSLGKSSTLPTAVPGATVTYTLGVTNAGPSNAPAAQLSDPFGAPFTAATWTCAAGPGAACTGGSGPMNNVALSLSAGASVTYTAVATIASSATGTLGNNATVSGGVTEIEPADNAGGVTVTLTPRADLFVTQTGSINPVVAGSGAHNLTYVITLTNRGLSDAAGVTVHETLGLPAGASLDAATPGAGTWNGSDWSLASLPAGGHATLALTLTVASQTAAGTDAITSTAAVTGAGTPLINTGDDAATVRTSVARAADLSVAKTDGAAAAIPGLPLVYTITVTNGGPSDADGATVTDAFPAVLGGVTWTCAGAGGVGGAQCGVVGGSGAISRAVDLPAGAGLTYVATATVGAGAVGTLANTASITVPAGTQEVSPADNTATDTDALTPRADLSLHKSSASPTAVPGATITYTLVVTNAGPSDAPAARLTDAFDPRLLAPVWTCAAGPGATCSGGAGPMNAVALSLPAGAVVTYTAVATVASSASGTLGNNASVGTGVGVTDPNSADNAGGVTVTLTPRADLFVTQTGSIDPVVAGSGANNLTYVITLTNRGPSDAANVTVGETLGLPAGVSLDAATPGAGTWNGSEWSLVTLPAGNHATLTLTLTVGAHAAAGTDAISSTATVTAADTPLTDTGDDTATVRTSIVRMVDLAVTKTDGVTTAVPGLPLVYTITVTNGGPSDADDVTVVDVLPAALTAMIWTCTGSGGGACLPGDSGSINDAAVNLPVGSAITYTITSTVAAGATGTLANTASVTAPAGTVDLIPGNNSATDTDILTPQTELGIFKDDGQTTAVPGLELTYRVVVSNAGPSDAPGATVSDPLPAMLSDAAWTCAGTDGGTCLAGGSGSINETTADLPVGGAITYTITGTVAAGASGSLANTATMTLPAGATDPTPDNAATDTDTLTPRADLSLSKSSTLPTAVPGATVTYTVVVTNAGPSDAPAARLTDAFDPRLLAPVWTCAAGPGASCAGGSGSMNNVALGLPAGAVVTYTAVATVASSASGTLGNNVSVGTGVGVTDPNSADNAGGATVTLTPRADLFVTQTGSIDPVVAGSGAHNLTYVITLTNRGPSDAANVTLGETLGLPAGVSLDAATPGAGTWNGSEWSLVTLPAGNHATLTLTLTVGAHAAAGTDAISSTATVTAADTPLTDTGDDTATVRTSVARHADLSVSKTDGAATAVPGTPLVYTIAVTNSGPSDADGATVTDALPTALSGATWTCAGAGGGTCGALGETQGDLSDTVQLPAGTWVMYQVTGTVQSAATGLLTNTAQVSTPAGTVDLALANNVAADVDALTPVADLVVAKSSAQPTAIPGLPVTYTIVISNGGPSDAPAARVTDAFGSSLLAPVWTCAADPGATCAGGSGPMNDVALSLPASAVVTYTAVATVASSATGALDNTASADPGPGVTEVAAANNTATATVSLTPLAGLTLAQAGSADPVTAGSGAGNLTYVVTVTNIGPSDAGQVVVSETLSLPTGVSFDAAAASAGALVGGNWTLASLPAGGRETLTVTLTAGPQTVAGTDVISATASVASADAELTPDSRTPSTVRTSVVRVADLAVGKSVQPDRVRPGQALTYTLTYTNNGPSQAFHVVITDILLPQLTEPTFVSDPNVTAVAGGFQVGTLEAHATGAITITARMDPAIDRTTTVANRADIGADEFDPAPGDNFSEAGVLVPVVDLVVAKSVTSPRAGEGAPVTFTVTAYNASNTPATAVVVSDTLPTGLSPAGESATSGGYSAPYWTIPGLAAGETVTLTLQVTVDAGTAGETLTNTARFVSAAEYDRDASNDAAAAAVRVLSADLGIAKTAPATATPGLTMTWTVTVTNDGPDDVDGAVVADTLPAAIASATWTCAADGGATCAAGSGDLHDSVSLPVGSRAVYTVRANVRSSAAGTVDNTASVAAAPGIDHNPANDVASASTLLAPSAGLSVRKTVRQALNSPDLVYTIVTTNAGPSDAPGAVLSDTAPAGLTGFDWTCAAAGGAVCPSASGSDSLYHTLTFPAGGVVTYTVAGALADVSRSVVNTAEIQAPATVLDPDPTDNRASARSALRTYLPLVERGMAYLPDLQVTGLVATTQAVTVTIRNDGEFEVHDPFWVDVYFNPRQAPRVNQPWPMLASAGVAFGVTQAIPPGGSLTLTMSGLYFSPGNSSHPPFPNRADVYAYVDSVDYGTTYGTVLETREDNNVAGPVRSVAGGAVRISGAGSTAGLPGR